MKPRRLSDSLARRIAPFQLLFAAAYAGVGYITLVNDVY